MHLRKLKGEKIASSRSGRIHEWDEGSWNVPRNVGSRFIESIDFFGFADSRTDCTCKEFRKRCHLADRSRWCRHIWALFFHFSNHRPELLTADAEAITAKPSPPDRTAFKPTWTNDDEADIVFRRVFPNLLHEFVKHIDFDPSPRGGLPTIPVREMVYLVVRRVFERSTTRAFEKTIEEAFRAKHLRDPVAAKSVGRYLSYPQVTEVLPSLIDKAAHLFRDVEIDFAVDASLFDTRKNLRAADDEAARKRKRERKSDPAKVKAKLHVMCGVQSHVVTAVEVTEEKSHEGKLLPALVRHTGKAFEIAEVSADARYSKGGQENFEVIEEHGAIPYLDFEDRTTGGVGGRFGHWFEFLKSHPKTWKRGYDKRNNVETTNRMIKAQFGDKVRSDTDVTIRNELHCKVICHNLRCVVHGMAEFGIKVPFWPKDWEG